MGPPLSLSRRIFTGGSADLESFNWVALHRHELALIGVERPRLLPFLQLVCCVSGAPLANLEVKFKAASMAPSAWRKLEGWGYTAFGEVAEFALLEDYGVAIARYANLLDRLRVEGEPVATFTQPAGLVPADAPDWFHRVLYDEIECLEGDDLDFPIPVGYEDAFKWIASHPAVDENQKCAGWA